MLTSLLSSLLPAGHIEAHLRYPHCWVWLTASQLFGQLFAANEAEKLVAVWRGEGGEAAAQASATTFITSKLDKKVRLRGPTVFFPVLNELHFQKNSHLI